MNNDLISREALKKALRSNCKPEICPDYKNTWCLACCPHNDFADLIEEAPTVEPIGQIVKAYTTGFDTGVETVKRQKGEWIDYSEEGFVECPFCHKATNCEDNIDELHFCWNCGAELKKGSTE